MNIKNIFHASYWFHQPDMATGLTRSIGFGFFLLLCVAGVAVLVLRSRQSDRYVRLVCARMATWGLVIGLGGLLWFTLRQQAIVFLSWRIWLAVWMLVAILWGASIVQYIIKRIPAIRAEKLEREMREKYLPKGKR